MKMYDYLVVGSGLYGSIFAREAADKGYNKSKGFPRIAYLTVFEKACRTFSFFV